MIGRRNLLLGAAAIAALGTFASAAGAADTIKIGEINSYARMAAFTEPYRNGWQLALEKINAEGGVDGKMIEMISRDDNGEPGEAVKIAEELVSKDKVDLLAGTFFSHIGLAVAEYAGNRKVFFLAAEPLTDAIVWEKGNRYTFRLRPSTYVQADMLAAEAAKLPAKKWATIAPNYAYGKDAVTAFKEQLKKRRPDVEFVAEQWPTLFKIDAGAEVQALLQTQPEAIYNVTFGPDLSKFVREGTTRGLFKDREVVSLLTGEPEYIDPLGEDTPDGWIVTGYPWQDIDTPEHKAFLDAYMAKFNDHPRLGSIVGYNMMLSLAAIIDKADSTETEALIEAARGVEVPSSPTGPFMFRAIDHQATMGAYVGRTGVRDGKGVMTDWSYLDGADHLPADDEVKAMRPADAMM